MRSFRTRIQIGKKGLEPMEKKTTLFSLYLSLIHISLDVLLLDLSTCRARFLKQGAPPSYILRKGRVYTIHAETLPVGILPEAAPVCPQDAQLMRGDAVVMMTDGLGDALGLSLIHI